MDKRPSDGILEEFRIEFTECWRKLPNKGLFLGLLVAWLALFQFFGNSTLGYTPTTSLMGWMYRAYVGYSNDFSAQDAYALLIPGVVLVLFWVKRKELLALDLKLWWPGIVLVGFGLVVHMLGYLVQQPRVSIVGLFTGLYGLTGLAWGPAWLRGSFFPFFLFAFCVPLGPLLDPISFRLQLLVCKLVEIVCHYVLAIDVILEGTQIKDPTGRYQYEVAAACSGIRSLIATIALSVILAFFSFQKWWKRVLVLASAFPLAVLGNLLRMLSIVVAADISGQKAGQYVHDGGPGGIFSLLPYIPAFLGLMLLDRYLYDPPPKPKQSTSEPAIETPVALGT